MLGSTMFCHAAPSLRFCVRIGGKVLRMGGEEWGFFFILSRCDSWYAFFLQISKSQEISEDYHAIKGLAVHTCMDTIKSSITFLL
jgi:hypothetical protein